MTLKYNMFYVLIIKLYPKITELLETRANIQLFKLSSYDSLKTRSKII